MVIDSSYKKTSGIYKIINHINGKFYVGSAIDLYNRGKGHIWALNKQVHVNPILQRAWNKYGINSFVFEILKLVANADELLLCEQFYLDELQPQYNICKTAGSSLGRKFSDETKRKISLSRKKYIGTNHPSYGKKRPDLAKRNRDNKGSHFSKEAIKNARNTNKNMPVSQYSLTGELLAEFKSINEASRQTGLRANGIVYCCKRQRKTSQKCTWRYSTDFF